MIQVYKIQSTGGNKWCGPSALSAITGLNTKDTAAMLRRVSGRKQITGTAQEHMVKALHNYGVWAATELHEKQTFGSWIKSHASKTKQTYLIVVGNHYVVVQGRQTICSLTNDDFVHWENHPKKRAFVTHVYRLSYQATFTKPVPPPIVKVVKPDVDTAVLADVKNLKAICEMFGLDLEVPDGKGNSTYWVEPPEGLFEEPEDDPYEDEHYRDTPGEALVIALEYAKLVQVKKVKEKG